MKSKKKVFVSFDYDNDLALKNLLVGQAKNEDSPFEISDWSLKEAAPEKDWEKKALAKIKRSDMVIVVVGSLTHTACGVKKEVNMANNNNIKVIQIRQQGATYKRVDGAGVLYEWTWKNLKKLLS